MSTHDPGAIYADWRRMERADRQIQKELQHDQILPPLSEYREGSAKWEALWNQILENQRFPWPVAFVVNL